MAGTYSDEIFKEQNAVIEEQIIAAQAAKSDELIDKYDINAINAFIKAKISNLPLTYTTSQELKELSQIRCLLGAIFMSGFTWDYPGCSHRGISPIYQEILDIEKEGVQISSAGRTRTYDQSLNRRPLYH